MSIYKPIQRNNQKQIMNISQQKDRKKGEQEMKNRQNSAQLTSNLYLMSQGLKKIEDVSIYKNLISLWLNNNQIEQIQNLGGLYNLRCLYLHGNRIAKIQGLENLDGLEILSLEKNFIHKIENLDTLQKLINLSLAHNQLESTQSIAHLKQLKLQILDLSSNEIQNKDQVFSIIKELRTITCLSIKATPFSRGFKNYRKTIIAHLHQLKFLDDRPVYEIDHRLAEAWLSGGIEQERAFRAKIMKQQEQEEKQKETYRKGQKNEIDRKKENEDQLRQQLKFRERLEVKRPQLNEEKVKQSIQTKKNQVDSMQTKKQDPTEQQAQDQALHNTVLKTQEGKAFSWPKQYNQLLKVLLEKYKFDFSQVQPQFNMIISSVNKKLLRPNNRYEIEDLQKMWTLVQIQYRQNK